METGTEPPQSFLSAAFNFLASLINGNFFREESKRLDEKDKAFNFLASLINGNKSRIVTPGCNLLTS